MKSKCFKFDKIVRDKACDILTSDGVEVVLKEKLDDEKSEEIRKIEYLKMKLCEEVQEVLEAETKNEIIEEIADCIEVVEALCKNIGITLEEVNKSKEEKKLKKGGFSKCTIVDRIIVPADNKVMDYYLKSPSKYPQVKKIS